MAIYVPLKCLHQLNIKRHFKHINMILKSSANAIRVKGKQYDFVTPAHSFYKVSPRP